MSDPRSSRKLSLTGEVVETFERDGAPVAKILLQSVHLEVPQEALHGAHLGDRLRLHLAYLVESIELDLHIDDEHILLP
jgi:hypothetical protein